MARIDGWFFRPLSMVLFVVGDRAESVENFISMDRVGHPPPLQYIFYSKKVKESGMM